MTPEGQPEVPLVFREERPAAGRMLPLRAGTIGREGCDVNLADPEVSRRHAAIHANDDDGRGPAIEDLGSRNGTWVNDRRIEEPTPLSPGDVVKLGNTVWHVTPT
jgi:pSer/pThr/pTyr-binding forkhead associated (FHA) protein